MQRHFEKSTARAVRDEHLNFVNLLFSATGIGEDNFVLTWDKIADSKPVQVIFVVTTLLLVHTETLLFKCKLIEAGVQHAVNWEGNYGLEKQKYQQLAKLYRPNKAMELM